jgi:hypothetical protein
VLCCCAVTNISGGDVKGKKRKGRDKLISVDFGVTRIN